MRAVCGGSGVWAVCGGSGVWAVATTCTLTVFELC